MNTYKLTELRNDYFKSTNHKFFIYLNIALLVWDVTFYIVNVDGPKWVFALWYLALIIILSQLLIFCCGPLVQLNELMKTTINEMENAKSIDDKKWAIDNVETCYNDSTNGLAVISIVLKDIIFIVFNVIGIIRNPWWANIITIIVMLGIFLIFAAEIAFIRENFILIKSIRKAKKQTNENAKFKN